MAEVPENAAQPQDHKAAQAPFVWTAPNGRKVTLIQFDRLPAGVYRKSKDLDEIQQTFALIEAATDDAGLEVIDELPIGDLDQLFTAWSEGSGASLPQS